MVTVRPPCRAGHHTRSKDLCPKLLSFTFGSAGPARWRASVTAAR